MHLTKRQHETLQFIKDYWEAHGLSPTYREIGEYLGGRSFGTVHEHVSQLVAKGFLRKAENESRSIEVVPIEPGEVGWPSERNGYEIPPGTKFVPVAALDGLFARWLRERRHPALVG